MNGYRLERSPWQPPPRSDGLGPRQSKSGEENVVQGKYENDTPVDANVFTEAYLAERQAEVVSDLIAERVESEVASRVPDDARGLPACADRWIVANVRAFGRKFPQHARAIERRLSGGELPGRPHREDVARCEAYLGEWQRPAPPAPERPRHPASYLEACGLLIAACQKQSIPLAVLDPLKQDEPPTVPLDARASAPIFGEPLLKRIEAGYHLGFAPYGRRAMPPSTDVAGHAFVPLPSGEGWIFTAVEVAR